MSVSKSYKLDDVIDVTSGISGGIQGTLEIDSSTLNQFTNSLSMHLGNPESIEAELLTVTSEAFEIKSRSAIAQKIIRVHYSKSILRTIKSIITLHSKGKLSASNGISELFKIIIKYAKENRDDPFTGYLLALFDGLSYNNAWISLENKKFIEIDKQIKLLCERNIDDYALINKEIMKLEDMGINTTPYGG